VGVAPAIVRTQRGTGVLVLMDSVPKSLTTPGARTRSLFRDLFLPPLRFSWLSCRAITPPALSRGRRPHHRVHHRRALRGPDGIGTRQRHAVVILHQRRPRRPPFAHTLLPTGGRTGRSGNTLCRVKSRSCARSLGAPHRSSVCQTFPAFREPCPLFVRPPIHPSSQCSILHPCQISINFRYL